MALRMTRPRMFAIFLGIALGGGALVAVLFANVWGSGGATQRAITIVHLMPVLLATLIVQGPILKQPVLDPLGLKGTPNLWWLVAWLAPVLVLALALAFEWLAGLELALDVESYTAAKRGLLPEAERAAFDEKLAESPPTEPFWYVLQALPAGVTLNLLLALATEIGWRGFLFREVQGGFWRRSFFIGLAEAAYLLPIAAQGWSFPGAEWQGAFLVVSWALVASPVLVYLRVRSQSVIAVAAFRGTLWALVAVASDLGPHAGAVTRPFYGWTGIAAMLVLLALLLTHDRFIAEAKLTAVQRP
jgi:hypothetical protein